MKIPVVTEEDLRNFGLSHFPGPQLPSNLFYEDIFETEHDDLGYYSDGEKRTLTDEQIAIFRNSEIQQLLYHKQKNREKNKKRNDKRFRQRLEAAEALITEHKASLHEAPSESPSAGDEKAANIIVEEATKEVFHEIHDVNPAKDLEGHDEAPGDVIDGTALEDTSISTPSSTSQKTGGARFHQKRPRCEKQAEHRHRKKLKKEKLALSRNESEEFTPRRIARELDEQVAEQIELDY